MKKSLFIIGVGTLILGAYLYYRKQLEILLNFTYKIKKVEIDNFSPLTLSITTEITNDSEISFFIIGYDIDVFVNGEYVALVKNSTLNQKLDGFGSKSQINFSTIISPKQSGVGSVLSSVLTDLYKTKIEFKGKVSVKKGLFTYANYPVDISWKLEEFL